MLMALLYFLVGCLVLAVVLYVAKLILAMMDLPPPVQQIALIIIGLVGLICLLVLVFSVLPSGGAVRLP
jgi:hypothetical protein